MVIAFEAYAIGASWVIAGARWLIRKFRPS
jgi:hypothetical protein